MTQSFYKRRLKSNLSFLRLFIVDQFMRLMEGLITEMKKNKNKNVYVQGVVIVAHIFPWFYVQERLKRPLWVGDRLPIQFF